MTNEDNIVLVAPIVERFVYAKPLKGNFAKSVYNETRARAAKDFKNAPAFNGYWKFNEKTEEINGSSNFWVLMANKVLRKHGLWIPSFREAKALERKHLLKNGVYRDYGNAVYNSQNPNSEIAGGLVAQAKKRGLALPILLPFKALDIKKANNRFGAKIVLTKEAEGLISGQEAVEALKEFNYRANAGARRLDRYDAGWNADWYDLDGSDDAGRMDFVCGEATQKSLETLALQDVYVQAKQELKRLEDRISAARKAYITALKA